MMNNSNDYDIPFDQGIQFFNALRRLGKKAWMLQYDNGDHGVHDKDALDYTMRLSQFFDYYLKDSPPAKWMTKGIPAMLKGVDSGFELDCSGDNP